jgi:pimeloyl-ACP methyl ester carboxylesterase
MFLLAIAPANAATPIAPGVYDAHGKTLYIGVEHELPDPPQNDFYDPATGHIGTLPLTTDVHQRCRLNETRRIIEARQGRIGASLYYNTDVRKATVILIHGADPETREMGFIIPYFVCNGVNVISYDQRGVGESPGNWFSTGPLQKAKDVVALYDAFRSDRHVDARQIGVWGFSNGGWVAPLVTLRRPIAFMILKSAPTESVLSNLHYEVVQEMRRHHAGTTDIAHALQMWRNVENALFGKTSWTNAQHTLTVAQREWWYKYSLMPKLDIPPAPAVASGLRRYLSFDPAATLTHVTTPTLALYGALDKKTDSADSALHMRRYLARHASDVTIETFPHATHTLTVSKNGYDAEPPHRYVPQYPRIMITWLAHRGFTKQVPD